jgi:hypothetical protein
MEEVVRRRIDHLSWVSSCIGTGETRTVMKHVARAVWGTETERCTAEACLWPLEAGERRRVVS